MWYIQANLLETHISEYILAEVVPSKHLCVRRIIACAPTRASNVFVQQQFTTSLLCEARTKAESMLRGL